MPFCSSCGVHCSDDESKEDTRGHTEIAGAVSWSRVERVHFCRACALSRARTVRLLLWAFVAALLFPFACVLLKHLFGN